MNVIYNWAEGVNMHFNADKFECLRFWPGAGDPPSFQYKGPDSTCIEVKTSLKDLGVQISSDLSFKLHIEKTIAGAAKLAGWGLMSFRKRSRDVMKTIWKSLVQLKMDYFCQQKRLF